jgi:PIN domain nuclease of toxin-antitoxin system
LTKIVETGQDLDELCRRLRDQGLLDDLLRVEPLDTEDALKIAQLRPATRGVGLSLADRACLALASRFGLPALTTDRAWLGLEVGVEVVVVR